LNVSSKPITQEIDYRNEARFAHKFGELYRSEHVVVPVIVHELCSERVLTMEWIDGVPLSQLAVLTEQERAKNVDTSHLDPGPIIEVMSFFWGGGGDFGSVHVCARFHVCCKSCVYMDAFIM
jgi:hypothetical protein